MQAPNDSKNIEMTDILKLIKCQIPGLFGIIKVEPIVVLFRAKEQLIKGTCTMMEELGSRKSNGMMEDTHHH